MAIRDKLTEEFLQSLKDIEPILLKINFRPYSVHEKGFAYYIQYKNDATKNIVKFIFGPSDWSIEMIIFTSKRNFEFKDLLMIPTIKNWVDNNKYVQNDGRSIKDELLYYIELLRVFLLTIH